MKRAHLACLLAQVFFSCTATSFFSVFAAVLYKSGYDWSLSVML